MRDASAILRLVLIRTLRFFKMSRLMIFVGFSLVGIVLAYSDTLVIEQEFIMAAFVATGFTATLLVEDRKANRLPIPMYVKFAYPNSTRGEGVVEDVSIGGCKVRSTTPATSEAEVQMQFYPPGQGSAIEIEKAFVRWTGDGQFGVQFSQLGQEHQKRLQHLLAELSSDQCTSHHFEPALTDTSMKNR